MIFTPCQTANGQSLLTARYTTGAARRQTSENLIIFTLRNNFPLFIEGIRAAFGNVLTSSLVPIIMGL